MLEPNLARGFRKYSLPETLSLKIWQELGLEKSARSYQQIAQDVLRMSDFYIENPNTVTPWDQDWCQRAQLAYFLPLNFIRNRAVFEQGMKSGFFQGLKSGLDVGSGLGAVSWALADLNLEWSALEISPQAQRISKNLLPPLQFQSQLKTTDMITFSFSMTEDISFDDVLKNTKNLMILEPALRPDSRALMKLRDELTQKGWSIWAPCTHQLNCPLLQNENDWCHDRVHFEAPDWFLEIEKLLPMKNKNLAHSYLLASLRPAPSNSAPARIVGDFIQEKGKSKVVACTDGRKENWTWLHRHLSPEPMSRGSLVEIPEQKEIKPQEVRLTQDLKILP